MGSWVGAWRGLNVHEKIIKTVEAEFFFLGGGRGSVRLDLSKQHARVGGGWVRISIWFRTMNEYWYYAQ